jgi:hypothetical protein
VAFALVRLARGTPVGGLRVHARDVAGALRAVYAGLEAELVSGRRRVLTGRRGRVSRVVSERRSSMLAPSVLDPARETVSACVVVAVRSPGMYDCTTGAPRHQVLRGLGRSPSRAGGSLPAGLPAAARRGRRGWRRVTALLGDGRRRAVRTVALQGAERFYALAIAGADAVRGVTLHPTGAPERFVALSLAPVAVLCAPQNEAPAPPATSIAFGSAAH